MRAVALDQIIRTKMLRWAVWAHMTEARRHVLIWVAPEFLRCAGLVRLFIEAGIFSPPEDELDRYISAAEAAGGFALTGMLAEAGHGAGIWISPVDSPGLQLMVPWQFVRSVVTAESPHSSKVFGLMSDIAQSGAPDKRQLQRRGNRNSVK